MTDHIGEATKKVIDLDALEKLAARIKSAGDDRRYPRFSDMESAGIGLEALIAELKEAKRLLQGLVDEVFDAITSDGEPQDCKAIELADLVEVARDTHRAFLARNGKGEG